MAQLDPEELGRRMRAARGYAGGTSQRAFAQELGIGESSLKRLESGAEGPAEVKLEAIVTRAAALSRLPRRFFESDLWVLDYLEQAISMLPEDVQKRPRDELIFEAFESYEARPADAGIDVRAVAEDEGLIALQAKVSAHDELLKAISRQLDDLLDDRESRGERRPSEEPDQRDDEEGDEPQAGSRPQDP